MPLLALPMPGTLNDLLDGRIEETEITGGLLAFFAIFWVVPFAMAYLSLVLNDPFNRYTNLVIGVLATAMWTWGLVEHLAEGEGLGGIYLLTAAMIVAGLMILWQAWRWPKPLDEKAPIDEETRIPAGTGTDR